jgi:hypothetical protein
MLHACVERFDVMGGRGNILGWVGEVNKAHVVSDVFFQSTVLLFFCFLGRWPPSQKKSLRSI